MLSFFNKLKNVNAICNKFELYTNNFSSLYISSLKKILFVCDETIEIDAEGRVLKISGANLKIEKLEGKYLVIAGKIKSVEVI